MIQKPEGCRECPLYGNGKGFIQPEGFRTNRVVIVGSEGGDSEQKDGKPFRPYAATGSKLEEVFRASKTRRTNFKLYNIINCKPQKMFENSPWESEAAHHCKKYLIGPGKTIDTNRENIILATGKIPMKYLTDFTGNKSDKSELKLVRGHVVKNKYGYVIPTYHPAFVRRGKPAYTQYLIWDLEKCNAISRNGWRLPTYQFQEHPGYEDIKSFYYKVKEAKNLPLAIDIETDDSADTEEDERQGLFSNTITQIQFSLGKDTGIAVPWRADYETLIRLLLLTPNEKLGFNWYNFDGPRVQDKGFKINGRVVDLMWMFKHWQPGLDRNLQSVSSVFDYPEPWKHHFHDRFEWYGCHDVSALHYIYEPLKARMQADGVYEGFSNHVVGFWPILDSARSEGVPVSKIKIDRLKEDLTHERNEVNKELQKLIPDELKLLEPKRKDKNKGVEIIGFSRTPKKIICFEFSEFRSIQEQWNGRNPTWNRYSKTFAEFLFERHRLIAKPEMEESTGAYSLRWFRQKPFKASAQQLIRYIKWKRINMAESPDKVLRKTAKFYKVPILKDPKKGIERETTGKKHLEDLLESTGDEVIRLIIGEPKFNGSLGQRAGIRSIDKIIKNDIKNWQPASDGRVHTTWGMTAASGQLDSRQPNILNASKHTTLGNIFREVIEAPEGYVIAELDKKSYHVATMGYCANDADYIRFSQLDPHSYFTAFVANGVLGLPNFGMADSEILEITKRYKNHDHWGKVRQNNSKVIVLGNQLGLGANKAYLQNRKFFNSVEEVKKLQTLMGDLFPKVEKFKKDIKREAHQKKRLVNDWGYQQWFWEVFTYKYESETGSFLCKPGTEAEKAIAFPVQSPAFGDIRDKLLQLRERGFLELHKFISTIHDSFIFLFERRLLDNFVADVVPLLVSPSRVLKKECCPKGLVVGVDMALGRNFGKYDPVKNPEGMRDFKLT